MCPLSCCSCLFVIKNIYTQKSDRSWFEQIFDIFMFGQIDTIFKITKNLINLTEFSRLTKLTTFQKAQQNCLLCKSNINSVSFLLRLELELCFHISLNEKLKLLTSNLHRISIWAWTICNSALSTILLIFQAQLELHRVQVWFLTKVEE